MIFAAYKKITRKERWKQDCPGNHINSMFKSDRTHLERQGQFSDLSLHADLFVKASEVSLGDSKNNPPISQWAIRETEEFEVNPSEKCKIEWESNPRHRDSRNSCMRERPDVSRETEANMASGASRSFPAWPGSFPSNNQRQISFMFFSSFYQIAQLEEHNPR
jgi:hypothetical protein